MNSKMLSALALAAILGTYPGSTSLFAQAGGGGGGGVPTKENLDLPFDAMGDSQDEEEAPEVIVFWGQQYEANFVCFTCDKSGSMAGEPWKKLQREVIKNITQFSDKVQFAIVLFDANITKFPTNGKPADANPALKAGAMAYVMSTQTGHGTCSKPALKASLQFANQSSAKEKIIIYLSDGHNTCNGADEASYSQQLLAEVAASNTQHVKINTLCFGGSPDENFMRTLATQNNGKCSRIN